VTLVVNENELSFSLIDSIRIQSKPVDVVLRSVTPPVFLLVIVEHIGNRQCGIAGFTLSVGSPVEIVYGRNTFIFDPIENVIYHQIKPERIV